MKNTDFVPFFIMIFAAIITCFLLGAGTTLAVLKFITPMQYGEILAYSMFFGVMSKFACDIWRKS